MADDQNGIALLRNDCSSIERCLRGVEMYLQMQKSLNFSPEMKVASFGEKIGMVIIVLNQFVHISLDRGLSTISDGNMPDELNTRVRQLREKIDKTFEELTSDILGSISQLGSPESLLARVDKKLDTILASPDYLPGQTMMRNAEKEFTENKFPNGRVPKGH